MLDETRAPSDFAALNQGQLKNLATAAYAEMLAHLGPTRPVDPAHPERALGPDAGVGPALEALVGSFADSNNYAAVNLGQFKTVAEPFWARLAELGLVPAARPWASGVASDYAIANLGQAKTLFAFDLASDRDSDGVSDLSEIWRPEGGTDPDDPDSDDDGVPDGEDSEPNDPHRDGDGVNDGQDPFPDDGRRSEHIPVTYYGVIDLSEYADPNGQPEAEEVQHIAIDDQNRVSWVTRNLSWAPSWLLEHPPLTVTTWVDGVAEEPRRIISTETSTEESGSRDLYAIAAVNGAGIVVGTHTIATRLFGEYVQHVQKGMPGDVSVPSELLLTFDPPANPLDSNLPLGENAGMPISVGFTRISATGLIAGLVGYVVPNPVPSGEYLRRSYCFRGNVNNRAPAHTESNALGPMSNSGQLILLGEPPVPGGRGRPYLWDLHGGAVEIAALGGLPDATPEPYPVEPKAVNDAKQVVGSLEYEHPVTHFKYGFEDPEQQFDDGLDQAGNPKTRPGRGILGFLWEIGEMQTFHDLLPEKYKKQIRSAVPYLITNAKPAANPQNPSRPIIYFRAEALVDTDSQTAVWQPQLLSLAWDDQDQPTIRHISFGDRWDASASSYNPLQPDLTAVNSNGHAVGMLSLPDRPTSVPILARPIEILDGDKVLNKDDDLVISKWENVFQQGSGQQSDPVLQDNFIDSLKDSFYLRVPNSVSASFPIPQLTLAIEGTRTVQGQPRRVTVDPETELEVETEPGGATAITKKSHILEYFINKAWTTAPAHEIGHVIADQGHDGNTHELMVDASLGAC